MQLKNAPIDQATMGDVAQVKAFAIKSTAQSFRILSSGLYANKIRAIVRELSCNAYDSHAAAGHPELPFEVHLPSTLEPWFSVRDFGVGLTHEQVINLYTTYFESTKTDSNLFIGALGLGSKSPFSYTNNFTVTAVKDGVKGIYTAFINEQGVPSVALMSQTPSNDSTGVEVRMAVLQEEDFYKFREEAYAVFKWFTTAPVVTGHAGFQITPREYRQENIIPGVHTDRRGWESTAVMGNIAYPIDVPNKKASLGDLHQLLDCGLEMHFEIGQLDFQASREGLSYDPSTIAAIKDKLQQLKDHLIAQVNQEAKAIDNKWKLAYYLHKKSRYDLWAPIVADWVKNNPVETIKADSYRSSIHLATFKLTEGELKDKYNIRITQVTDLGSGYRARSAKKEYTGGIEAAIFEAQANEHLAFVINDVKQSAIRRTCDYFSKQGDRKTLLVLSPVDSTAPMDTVAFFAALYEPPAEQIHSVSDFEIEKPIKTEREPAVLARCTYSESWSRVEISLLDDTDTYYYLPLKGFQLSSQYGVMAVQSYVSAAKVLKIPLPRDKVYGVRQIDLPIIDNRPNWINLETHIRDLLINMTPEQMSQMIPQSKLMGYSAMTEQKNIFNKVSRQGLYWQFVNKYGKQGYYGDQRDSSFTDLSGLSVKLLGENNLYSQLIKEHDQMREQVMERYPLIACLDTYRVDIAPIVHYINIIDQSQTQEKH
jgi:hypothetical protein